MTNHELKEVIEVLKKGGVIAYPTETSYGLGCDPRNEMAVAKIFELKGRDIAKSLPLIAGSINQVKDVAELSAEAEGLANKYWPGPLTMILPLKMTLAPNVAKDNEIAIRVSSHPAARKLAEELGFPIVATSLNKSGEPSVYDLQELPNEIRDLIDAIVDTGPLQLTEPSTIVRLNGTKVDVIRKGAIKL